MDAPGHGPRGPQPPTTVVPPLGDHAYGVHSSLLSLNVNPTTEILRQHIDPGVMRTTRSGKRRIAVCRHEQRERRSLPILLRPAECLLPEHYAVVAARSCMPTSHAQWSLMRHLTPPPSHAAYWSHRRLTLEAWINCHAYYLLLVYTLHPSWRRTRELCQPIRA